MDLFTLFRKMKWLLVDGFNLAFRAFYAMPSLTRPSDGFPVGAIHAWVRILWKLQDQEAPCKIVIFFDKDGSQRHLSLHAEYKANRAETPPELVLQFPELKLISEHFGFCIKEQSGVEADDLIASTAQALSASGEEVWIASADKDFAQCVNDRVRLLAPPPPAQAKAGWLRMDAEKVREKFGVTPSQIVDYLSLIGDSVDNIPGLPGVGPKTAAMWLNKYGTIDEILNAKDVIEPIRFREIISGATELLKLNRQLITFQTNFQTNLDAPYVSDLPACRTFFERMEMKSTLKELEQRAGKQLELF
ncbi:MAG: hypothetical protein LBV12_01985 [Puniceicoccales bacterium]|jgi:DNA polymerase-1|nr:hypothetical protein [Puniceicoccales bacterium]